MTTRWHDSVALVAASFVFVLLSSRGAAAQPEYEVLHAFEGLPGSATASLVVAADGTQYGLTTAGGPVGAGILYKVQEQFPSHVAATLHEFNGIDGRTPLAPLIQGRDGALYGTTAAGGAARRGTIFKFTEEDGLTVLHTFNGRPEGEAPMGALTQTSDGTFHGTTARGGAQGFGTIFAMTPEGTVTTVHSFRASDGSLPASALVEGADGDLYGLTYGRFIFPPSVFKLTRAGVLTALHVFDPATSGVIGLTRASDGNFYGATGGVGPLRFFRISPAGVLTWVHAVGDPEVFGHTRGSGPLLQHTDGALYGLLPLEGPNGHGTVFRLTMDGQFTVLRAPDKFQGRSFAALIPGVPDHFYGVAYDGGLADTGHVFTLQTDGQLFTVTGGFLGLGAFAPIGTPVRGPDGALYGTTVGGGLFNRGTVYRLAEDGTRTTLHMFHFLGGGAYPWGGLVLASDGFFYGTTTAECLGSNGGGVFRVSLDGRVTTLHCFQAGEGRHPQATLIEAADGNLYGTTVQGGAHDFGTAFRVTPSGEVETFHSFDAVSSYPVAPLVEDADGNLYGTTAGPPDGVLGGSIFRLTPSGERTTLHVFGPSSPPERIFSGLAPTSEGHFVGTTMRAAGDGQVFRISPAGDLTMLATIPLSAWSYTTPVVDPDGFIYGTSAHAAITGGTGAIFRVNAGPPDRFVNVKTFGPLDGKVPHGALTREADGSFLGTAIGGGPNGQGVIFRFRKPAAP